MFQQVGYLIGSAGPSGYGSKSTAEDVTVACPDLRSITAIITGATSGIGEETARVLAMRGARLVLPARNLAAAAETKARITSESPAAEITVLPLDLSSLSSVRGFVARFLSLQLPLHLLVNNAGKYSDHHGLSDDGVEMTFATNHLGHFLLTGLLLETMAETARATGVEGRIVNVSSCVHGWFPGDGIGYLDLVTRKKIPYNGTRAYVLSKRANVLYTVELGKRLKEMKANVTVNCLHPGVVRTRIIRDFDGFVITDLICYLASKFLKTIPQGAATTCYVATHPSLTGILGKYFVDCNEAPPSASASDGQEALALWHASEAMIAGKALQHVGLGSKTKGEDVKHRAQKKASTFHEETSNCIP